MPRTARRHTITKAVLTELGILGLLIVSAFLLPTGCAQWKDTAHTADELAIALCKQWVTQHPGTDLQLSMCDAGGALFSDVVNLINAKASPEAAREALIAHPALMEPCLTPKGEGTP